jgi:DNA-binding PadR family transcriptional regulator
MLKRKPLPEPRRPLSLAVLHILLAIADTPRHGYAIKQEVESRSAGAVRLGPGTLYEAIQRLLDSDLIRETDADEEPTNAQEAQRRYYTLTARGRRILRQEIEQLGRLVDYARTKPGFGEGVA